MDLKKLSDEILVDHYGGILIEFALRRGTNKPIADDYPEKLKAELLRRLTPQPTGVPDFIGSDDVQPVPVVTGEIGELLDDVAGRYGAIDCYAIDDGKQFWEDIAFLRLAISVEQGKITTMQGELDNHRANGDSYKSEIKRLETGNKELQDLRINLYAEITTLRGLLGELVEHTENCLHSGLTNCPDDIRTHDCKSCSCGGDTCSWDDTVDVTVRARKAIEVEKNETDNV